MSILPGRRANPAFQAYHRLWNALDWFFPPECGGCGAAGQRWCATCQQSCTRLAQLPTCPTCGDLCDGLCTDCAQNPPPFSALRSWSLYDGALREAIHALKYQKDISMADALAGHLIEVVLQAGWQVDLVTAVPLGRARLAARGYNQSALLARPLALYLDKPFAPKALMRTRETHTQVGLSAAGRRANLTGAFLADPKAVVGRCVLVVDDVTTTGATITACAQALNTAGAVSVFGLTLARAARQANRSAANPPSVSNQL